MSRGRDWAGAKARQQGRESARAEENQQRALERAAATPQSPAGKFVQQVRYRVTDLGVKYALALAAEGQQVVYAATWSPGSTNEDALRGAGVEVHIDRPRGGGGGSNEQGS